MKPPSFLISVKTKTPLAVKRVKPRLETKWKYSCRFPEIHRPEFTDQLRWPDDLTVLPAKSISDLLGKFTALQVYANQEHARIQSLLVEAQTEIQLRETEVFRANPAMNHQERWKRDAVVSSDPVIMELTRRIGRLKAEREYASGFALNYERYVNALSRELSRQCHTRV